MPLFHYVVSKGDSQTKGKIPAASPEEAQQRLESMGFHIVSMTEDGNPVPIKAAPGRASREEQAPEPSPESPPATFGQVEGIKAPGEALDAKTDPPPPPEKKPPQYIEVRRRQSLLFGEHHQISTHLNILLSTRFGEVKQIRMHNDMRGKIFLAVVVEHDEEIKKKEPEKA